jgi:hypothetical protein
VNYLIGSVRISIQNRRFEKWQRKNPGKQFKDYFAEKVTPRVLRGDRHATLGHNLPGLPFGEVRRDALVLLEENGLTRDDVLVDYGCGTLRVGVHIIRFLRPGGYWGLDVDEAFLDEGRRLIGKSLVAEKAPHLRVISPATIAEASAARPKILFSHGVLIHVHPAELHEYFGNIMKIIGTWGRAIIHAKWSAGKTLQFSGQSWAHSKAELRDVIRGVNGDFEIAEEDDAWIPDFGRPVKKGLFFISATTGEARKSGP